MGSITGLGVLNETLDVACGRIPKHDAGGETRVLDRVRDLVGPEMEHYDVFRSKEDRDPWVITHSPSNGELSGTRGGG